MENNRSESNKAKLKSPAIKTDVPNIRRIGMFVDASMANDTSCGVPLHPGMRSCVKQFHSAVYAASIEWNSSITLFYTIELAKMEKIMQTHCSVGLS